ncbi:hypothetical protein [Luteimonas sp. A478]
MHLDALQRTLETRYGQLSGERAEDRRIFALEHDQTIDIAELATELSKQARYGKLDARYWLVWVVFASEVGYSYAGAEYWQTFGDRLPAWRQCADSSRNRSQIRVWFRQFSRKYRGVRPSGTWAQQFSIIAWPITHAILPQDLQYHFAKSLHTNRYRLATNNDPLSVGRLIRANSALASSRFREFSEQEELVGRIALALLGVETEEPPLSPETTKRIVADLERTQSAKNLLREARDVRRIRGASRNPQAGRTPPSPQQSPAARFNLAPNLLLSKENDAWRMGVLIPSFSPLASEAAEIRQFLNTTKVQLQGGTGAWQPAQILTRPTKLHMLQQWPKDGVVVKFKDAHPILEHLLSQDGTLSEGPLWVCKVGADGLARQVRQRLVRPGHEYIVLANTGHSFPRSSVLNPVDVECQGVVGMRLALPQRVPADTRQVLHSLNLRLATTVTVWPAGIPALSWDGEGRSEWLTTDAPCFGIDVDHDVAVVDVALDGASRLSIPRQGVKGPSWLQLPRLPSGSYTLTVEVKIGANLHATRDVTRGEVLLEVRDPLGMEETISQRGGLMAIPSPVDATLDDLEQGRLTLDLFGPRARKVKVRLEIVGFEDFDAPIGKFELPVTLTDLWAKLGSESQELLGVSSTCKLVADAEELGSFVLPLDRVSRPVRWLPKQLKQTISLRLIDEAGLGNRAVCQMAPLDAPNRSKSLVYDACVDGIEVGAPGGLYVVTGKGRMDAVIVSLPSQQRWSDLASLSGFTPKLDGFAVSAATLKDDIQLLKLWAKARAVGPFGTARQKQVLRAMRGALTKLVCGAAWLQAEATYERSNQDADAIADLGENITAIPAHRSFAAKLRMSHKEVLEKSPIEVVSWLLPISSAFDVCNDSNVVERGLRFFTDPAGFTTRSTDVAKDVRELATQGELVRGIRYLQIMLEGKPWDWS